MDKGIFRARRFVFLLGITAFMLSVLPHGSIAAEGYPDRVITMVVPYSPGGPNDTIARIVSRFMSEDLGRPIIIENKPGAGSAIGARYVAQSKPDGYTLLMGNTSTFALAPAILKNAGYTLASFEPIALAGEGTVVLAASPSFPPNNIKEFIAYAKANPGKVSFGTVGAGNTSDLAADSLKRRTDVDFTLVPYKGGGDLAAALLGGWIQLAFLDVSTTLQQIQDGKMKPIAVASVKRAPELPDVPTIAESGVPNFYARLWTALVAPAGTDAKIVARLNASVNNALKSEEVKVALAKIGTYALPNSPAELAQLMKEETQVWSGMVKESGASIE
jgi:tripartite-type tricarboxylate transporter receptor subunit TctC